MLPLIIEEETDAILSGEKSDAEPLPTDMLGDIRDGSQSHLSISRREAHYKIRDRMKQGQEECKGELS